MTPLEELEAKIEDLRAQLHRIAKGDELKTKASGFRLGSMRIYEDVAGILRSSGKITCHYGTAAERVASTDYKESVFWWESDNEDLYMGTGAAWQVIGGASGAAPGTHHATHENTGADEISVSALSGVLADNQPSDHATPIATHTAIATAHHAKYTNAEAVAAVEAEDPLDLAGVLNMVEISTPSNPTINIVSIFARANGSNIEVIALSSTGAEAVLCTLADTVHVNVLTINWIE